MMFQFGGEETSNFQLTGSIDCSRAFRTAQVLCVIGTSNQLKWSYGIIETKDSQSKVAPQSKPKTKAQRPN